MGKNETFSENYRVFVVYVEFIGGYLWGGRMELSFMTAITELSIRGAGQKDRSSGNVIKHLMTGPKGNSEFCFPETLNVPRGEAEGNIEVEGKQNSLFPEGPAIKCFVIPSNSK